MSTLLNKKYDVINRQSTEHRSRTKGKKSDVKSIKTKIDNKLNGFMRKPSFWDRNHNEQELRQRIYKEIDYEMNELKYISESYNVRQYVQNYALSQKTIIKNDVEKIVKLGMENIIAI
jgi:hypothetical protein